VVQAARRRTPSKAQRAKAFYRIGGVCHVCGDVLNWDEYRTSWVIDHVRPRKRGGSDQPINFLPASARMKKLADANEKKNARSEAKRLIANFVALDELVMGRQRTAKSWPAALDQVLRDSHTPRKLKEAYLDLQSIGFRRERAPG